MFAGSIHVFIRLFLGIPSLVVGIYFTLNAHNTVFNKSSAKPKLITTGVYALVRHPMYFGILLVCLGFFFTSLSLLSLLVWLGFFVFYDKMASYEEQSLLQILGKQYVIYQKKVPKWLPRIKKGVVKNNQGR